MIASWPLSALLPLRKTPRNIVSEAFSQHLAEAGLGNDFSKARDLLCNGADVSYDFNAAVQNAAGGGHKAVLKLVLVADEDFLAAKSDAMRAAGRAHRFDVNELLLSAHDAGVKIQKELRKKFLMAVQEKRTSDASVILDQMVALMFPRSPRVE